MGLFGKKEKETCYICKQNDGTKKILNGVICDSCLAKCGYLANEHQVKTKTPEQVITIIKANERNTELAKKYKSTNNIQKYLDVDENNKIWGVPCFSTHIFFTYDDIVSFELIENGNAVTKGGIGGAVVGGALFGGVGAVVGSVAGKKKTSQEITQYCIKIITRNVVCPEVYINFLIAGKVKSDSFVYKSYAATAQRVLTMLTLMMDEQQAPSTNTGISEADEILKYKQLLDDGAITQEEYGAKKKQLLGI